MLEEKAKQVKREKSLLKMKGIHKFYGSVHALKRVDFEVKSSEIIGLIGDNGAGKSTLAEIIGGNISKSRGKIFWKGEEVDIPSVEAARDLGIETVYQDKAVIDVMSVAENIFLSREHLRSVGLIKLLDKEKMKKKPKGL